MRLVYRDKGCAVCLAAGIQKIYKYCEDLNCFKESHIIDYAHHKAVSHFSYIFLKTYPIIISGMQEDFQLKLMIHSLILSISTIHLQVQVHKQRQILDE